MADRWYNAGYSGSANAGKMLKLHVYTIATNLNNNTTTERTDLIMNVSNTIGGWWNNYGSPCYVGIDGNNTNRTVAWDARTAGDKWLIASWDTVVVHNTDGTKTIGISASHTTNVGLGNASISDTYTCDRIPRQANITGANNFNDEQNPYMTFNNLAGFSLNARLEFAGVNIQRNNIANTGNYNFILTEYERDLLRSKCQSSNTLAVKYVIATIIDGTEKWWSSSDKVMTIINANPLFNNFTFLDTNTVITALTGNNQKLVKGYSNVKAIVSSENKAVAQKKANILLYRFQIGQKQEDVKYNTTEDVSVTINNVDNNVIRMYAVDSRGNTTSKDISPTSFVQYLPLKITNASAIRGNKGIGSSVTLEYSGEFWNNNFGAVQNEIVTATYRYKKTNASTWINGSTNIIPTISNNTFNKGISILGDLGANGFDVKYSYNIEVTIKDKLSQFTQNVLLGTGKPAIAIAEGVAIGAPYDASIGGSLQVNGINMEDKIEDISGKNLNNLTTHYMIGFGLSLISAPEDLKSGYLIYMPRDEDNGIQIFIDLYATKFYSRPYMFGGDFGEWQNNTKPFQKILYENINGTTGNITLSDSVINYSYIEIIYREEINDCYITKIYEANGKTAKLSTIKSQNEGLYLKAKTVNINGTNMTVGTKTIVDIRMDGSIGTSHNDAIVITKVIGYK